ncbi:hypothetical protein DYB37_003733 [Aphanomyces astaci]|uniref:FHA domain-containing protein n=1 Tax=Aphanomyces astaci TaxID=112090 RepID=A0A3R6X1Z1_APHAT|nr:hypothetical protein DYB35_000401 [Aphanomyces astaci]RHZ07085.1 hypothetical protein DYB37_003733 [Aphanomyces astaci]
MGFSFLPAPTRSYEAPAAPKPRAAPAPTASSSTAVKKFQPTPRPPQQIPAYPHRTKKQFSPRDPAADFGDGGAYPEIHISQFPLGLGKKGGGEESNVLSLQVNESGRAAYDAIVKKKNQIVYSSFNDLVEKDVGEDALAKPTLEEEQEVAEKTRAALEALVTGKIAAAHPVNVDRQKNVKETSTYIRYTPHDQGLNADSEVPKQRIIRMVEAPVDPIQPAKFKHKKAVRGPPSPPVPVMHSPPRKLTVMDQQAWKIPPCVSNWKNAKGYTIALDKRLAADGRGLMKVTVNDQFASFAEALAIAERKAREEVNMRIQVQKRLDAKQKEAKEVELREVAAKARQERGGGGGASHYGGASDRSDDDDDEGRRERDKMRFDRRREREREMRLENLMGKKGKLARDEDRDVSEKIALGQLQGGGKRSDASLFDSRLFNQSQGMDSGFGGEDDYNVYSKPMVDRGKSTVYRPKVDATAIDGDREYDDLKAGSAKRFRADKEFQGTDHAAKRSGPATSAVELGPTQQLAIGRSKKFVHGKGQAGGLLLTTDLDVSSRHAHVVVDPATNVVCIRDCKSTNGTKLNDTPLPPDVLRPLAHGDTIMAGSSLIVFRVHQRCLYCDSGKSVVMELAVALSRSVVAEDVECAVSRGMLEREIADVDASIAKLQKKRLALVRKLHRNSKQTRRVAPSSILPPQVVAQWDVPAVLADLFPPSRRVLGSRTISHQTHGDDGGEHIMRHCLVVPSLAPFFAQGQLNNAAESAPFEVQTTFPAWKENLTFLASCSVASVEAAHARLRAEMTKLKEAATDDPNADNMAVVYKALEYFDQHMQSTILHKTRQNDVGNGATTATVMTTGDEMGDNAVPVLR